MARRQTREKRAFGEISPLPSGRYRARYRGPDGERHSAPVTLLSRMDAETWLSGQARKISAGDWVPPTETPVQGVRVEEFARGSLSRRRLRPGTVALYDRLLRLEILPVFGAHGVRDISAVEIADWYHAMSERPTQQANAYGLLKSLLRDAVDDGIIERNPCRVKGGSNKHALHEIKVLTPAQLGRYLDAVPAARRVPLLLAGWCGLRSGEVRGLRVQRSRPPDRCGSRPASDRPAGRRIDHSTPQDRRRNPRRRHPPASAAVPADVDGSAAAPRR